MTGKITTIEQVLSQAEALNKLIEGSEQTTDIINHNIESIEDLEAIAKQEGGHFFDFEGYKACSVILGKINYLLTNKNTKNEG